METEGSAKDYDYKKLKETSEGSGLQFDALNLIAPQRLKLDMAERNGRFDKLKPIQTYEEYVRAHYTPEEAEKEITTRDPERIKMVNELVAEYNAFIPQIQDEKNAQLGREILDKIEEVFG